MVFIPCVNRFILKGQISEIFCIQVFFPKGNVGVYGEIFVYFVYRLLIGPSTGSIVHLLDKINVQLEDLDGWELEQSWVQPVCSVNCTGGRLRL